MSKCRILPLILVVACLLPTAQARLVFENTEVEIAADLTDTEAEVVFPFRNGGDEPVKIVGLRSSCGCTVPKLEKRDYAPGESGEIRALFTFGKRTGSQHKRVRVQTNEVPQGMYDLVFKTEIPVWGTVQPQMVRWPAGAPVTSKTVSLRIEHPDKVRVASYTRDLEAFVVDKVEKENGLIEFLIQPTDTASRITKRFEIELALGEGEDAPTRRLVSYCLIR